MRDVGHVLEQHLQIAIEIRLGNQGDELLLIQGAVGMRRKHQRRSGSVGQLKNPKLLIHKGRGRW